MANPVLFLDLRLSGRRGKLGRVRFLYAAWLSIQVLILGGIVLGWPIEPPPGWVADAVVQQFLALFVIQHFLLLLVITPAYCCGAIADERESGTLLVLMTAQLSSWNIVWGKFLSRLIQVSTFALVGLPLLCLVGRWFGYLTGLTILGLIALSLAVIVGLGGYSFWQSVRTSEPRKAAIRLYGLLLVMAAALTLYWQVGLTFLSERYWDRPEVLGALDQVNAVLTCFDPLFILEPGWSLGGDAEELWRRLAVPCGLGLMVGMVCLGLSAWRLRQAALQPLDMPVSRRSLGPRREPVPEDEPIGWREQLRRRHWPHWLGAVLVAVASTEVHRRLLEDGSFWHLPAVWSIAGTLLSLPVMIRASGTITRERHRKTWESVLSTPFEGWQIVLEKRRGVLRRYGAYYVAFLLPALTLPWAFGVMGGILSLLMFLLWSMVLLYLASTGIRCSALASNSWQSLVATVGRGYGFFLAIASIVVVGNIALACLTTPIVGIITNFTGVESVPEVFALILVAITSVYLAYKMYQSADHQLWIAQTWIETRERYGRTFTRSLSRALKKVEQRQRGAEAERQPLPAPP